MTFWRQEWLIFDRRDIFSTRKSRSVFLSYFFTQKFLFPNLETRNPVAVLWNPCIVPKLLSFCYQTQRSKVNFYHRTRKTILKVNFYCGALYRSIQPEQPPPHHWNQKSSLISGGEGCSRWAFLKLVEIRKKKWLILVFFKVFPGSGSTGVRPGLPPPASGPKKYFRGHDPAGVGVKKKRDRGLQYFPGPLPRRGRGLKYFLGSYPAGVRVGKKKRDRNPVWSGVKKRRRGRGLGGVEVDPETPIFVR